MKKMAKDTLQKLYAEYVEPGIKEWQEVATTTDPDKAFLMWSVDLVLDELELTHEEIIKACEGGK